MSEMIERVARALCEADDLDWSEQADPQTSGSGDNNQASYLHAARAAIAAMREPTQAMVAAAASTPGIEAVDQLILNAHARNPEASIVFPGEGSPLIQAHRAMIDAALAEGETP